ncbi:ribonuclease R [Clostridium sp. CAG:557]|nr:ribonuclease R [Clostridium sp. CAG:557]
MDELIPCHNLCDGGVLIKNIFAGRVNSLSNIKNDLLYYINSQVCAVPIKTVYNELNLDDIRKFNEAVDELIGEAKLILTKKDKLISPKACGFIPAKVISHTKSCVFAKPLFGGEDLYIPIEKSKKCMLGDIVMLNRVKDSAKGKNAAVERIVTPGNRIISGKVLRTKRGAEFIADSGYKYSIPIKKNKTKGIKNDDKVLAKLFSEKESKKIFAKVIKVYGQSQSARVCADAIIDTAGILTVFDDATLKEAKKLSKFGINSEEIKNRIDLRNELIFTIDGEDAKDLDDAISIKKTKTGWQLGVHIADVSHYIKPGSHLDNEAMERGTSVYFADRVIPMLPKELSNGICSLNANEDRLAFSALLNIDKKGNLKTFEFKKSVINSKVRGIYSEVNSILMAKASEKVKKKYSLIENSLLEAYELSKILHENAQKRGNMELESTEARFKLDDNGVCVDVKKRTRGAAEEMIEQFMIMANQAAALYAKGAQIPFVFRVHEMPSPEKINILAQTMSLFGLKAYRIRQGLKVKDISDILEQIKGTDISSIVSNQVLRSMSKARYFEEPLGHFGLALEDYCHFTSPIRRYPDTAIHRILSDLVRGVSVDKIEKNYKNFVKSVSEKSSECEIRAMKAERDAEKCYMAEYMQAHIGETFEGKISGVIQTGLFVELESGIEGFVEIEYFPGYGFEFDGIMSFINKKSGISLSIGDKITVKVLSADVSAGKIDFIPV